MHRRARGKLGKQAATRRNGKECAFLPICPLAVSMWVESRSEHFQVPLWIVPKHRASISLCESQRSRTFTTENANPALAHDISRRKGLWRVQLQTLFCSFSEEPRQDKLHSGQMAQCFQN